MQKPFIKNVGNTWILTDSNIQEGNVLHSTQEYRKYWDKIKRGENFAFLRYGDGERMLMLGQEVRSQEGWTAPPNLTNLGRALQSTLAFTPPPRT